MATKITATIESLIERGRWADARKRIERELKSDPENHWLLTQLGVTLYEEQRYREALVPLLKSLEIVPDCPLTLWNVAGTLDALGESKEALSIYTWLLQSKQTADADQCWESEEWADALKTDCVYRAALCLQHLGQAESAERFFRQYIDLLLAGRNGMYSLEDAARHIRELRNGDGDVRAAVASTLKDPGVTSLLGHRPKLLTAAELAGLAKA